MRWIQGYVHQFIFIYRQCGPVPIGDPGKGLLEKGNLHINTLNRVQSTVKYRIRRRRHFKALHDIRYGLLDGPNLRH